MLKLENSIRGLSFSRVAFDLTIQDIKPRGDTNVSPLLLCPYISCKLKSFTKTNKI